MGPQDIYGPANPELITLLEKLLSGAKTGRIKHMVFITIESEGASECHQTEMENYDGVLMMGRLELLKIQIADEINYPDKDEQGEHPADVSGSNQT